MKNYKFLGLIFVALQITQINEAAEKKGLTAENDEARIRKKKVRKFNAQALDHNSSFKCTLADHDLTVESDIDKLHGSGMLPWGESPLTSDLEDNSPQTPQTSQTSQTSWLSSGAVVPDGMYGTNSGAQARRPEIQERIRANKKEIEEGGIYPSKFFGTTDEGKESCAINDSQIKEDSHSQEEKRQAAIRATQERENYYNQLRADEELAKRVQKQEEELSLVRANVKLRKRLNLNEGRAEKIRLAVVQAELQRLASSTIRNQNDMQDALNLIEQGADPRQVKYQGQLVHGLFPNCQALRNDSILRCIYNKSHSEPKAVQPMPTVAQPMPTAQPKSASIPDGKAKKDTRPLVQELVAAQPNSASLALQPDEIEGHAKALDKAKEDTNPLVKELVKARRSGDSKRIQDALKAIKDQREALEKYKALAKYNSSSSSSSSSYGKEGGW